MPVNIDIVRKEIKNLLTAFASEQYQKKAWVDERHKYIQLFYPTEFICMWFDDLVGRDAYKLIARDIFSLEEAEVINSFNVTFMEFADKYNKKEFDYYPEQLLNYAPWLNVRQKAQETLKKLGWNSN